MRYTIGTSAGRLFALRIETSFSSNAILSIKPISKARGMLARVGNLFAATSINPQGGIAAVVAYKGKSSQKEQSLWSAFAVSDRIVQEWRFTEAGEEVRHLNASHLALD